ncbi:MAG: nitroreductase family protein [Candidatus Omnitrophota bacterium]
MSIIKVDAADCVNCGACVEVCPLNILVLDENKNPKAIAEREKLCIDCGHCACVCPKGALSLGSMPIDTLKELPASWRLTPEKVEVFFKGRRSIRVYKETPVEKPVIEKMIDIARYAPSGINRQSVYWAVIHDAKKVQELAGLTIEWMRALVAEKDKRAESLRFEALVTSWDAGQDHICRKAPHIAIVYGLKEDMLAPAACAIAMAHFELIALPFGLGGCWAGYLQMALNASAPARKAAGLSTKTVCHGAMLFGYPRYEYNCIPLRNEPRIIWR